MPAPYRILPQRQHRVIRSRVFWLWRSLFYATFIGIVGLVIVLLINSSWWDIKEIEIVTDQCEQPYCVSSSAVYLLLEQEFLHSNLIKLNKSTIEELIRREHFAFSQIVVSKQYPNHLQVELVSRLPLFWMCGGNCQEKFLIDSEGIAFFSSTSDFGLPRYQSDDLELFPGATLDQQRHRTVFQVMEFAHEVDLSLVEHGDSGIKLWVGEDVKVNLSSDILVKEQVKSLIKILESARIKGQRLSSVDFRFGEPLVTER